MNPVVLGAIIGSSFTGGFLILSQLGNRLWNAIEKSRTEKQRWEGIVFRSYLSLERNMLACAGATGFLEGMCQRFPGNEELSSTQLSQLNERIQQIKLCDPMVEIPAAVAVPENLRRVVYAVHGCGVWVSFANASFNYLLGGEQVSLCGLLDTVVDLAQVHLRALFAIRQSGVLSCGIPRDDEFERYCVKAFEAYEFPVQAWRDGDLTAQKRIRLGEMQPR